MKASQLIEQLAFQVTRHGDLEVHTATFMGFDGPDQQWLIADRIIAVTAGNGVFHLRCDAENRRDQGQKEEQENA